MGLLVLGMHRSGTSATTAALAAAIEGAEVPEDDFPPIAVDIDDNPRGYLESQTLTLVNDYLLAVSHGSLFSPPDPEPDWDRVPEFDRLRARTAFHRVFQTDRWIWKDPRTCLTAPFWLRVLAGEVDGIIIVFRHPLDVADSVANSPRGVSKTEAIALWSRYMADALRSAQGHRTLVTGYRTLMDAPERWVGQVRQLVNGTELRVASDPATKVTAVVDRSLDHSSHLPDELEGAPSSARQLFSALASVEGVHSPLPAITV